MALGTSAPLAFGNNAEFAQALSNPVASLISLPIQNNIDFGVGPGDGTKWTTKGPYWGLRFCLSFLFP